MSIAKEMDEAIVKHFEIPRDIRLQARFATWDLYYGPSSAGLDDDEDDDGGPVYLGFTKACSKVSDWCDEELSEVWYEVWSGCVVAREPEGFWMDLETGDHVLEHEADAEIHEWQKSEDYFHADISDVKRALFGKELVQHI